jgi:hypothetical protein
VCRKDNRQPPTAKIQTPIKSQMPIANPDGARRRRGLITAVGFPAENAAARPLMFEDWSFSGACEFGIWNLAAAPLASNTVRKPAKTYE